MCRVPSVERLTAQIAGRDIIMKALACSILAASTALVAFSAPAQAATCLVSDITGPQAAADCDGYFSGNIFNNGGSNPATVVAALQSLGLADAGSIDFGDLYNDPAFKLSDLSGATTLAFSGASELFGDTYIGIHWGGQGGGQSAIYKISFDEPTAAIDILGQNPGGSSNAVLFATQPVPGAVPEPASWAMMIAGFGLVGSAMRRRSLSVRFA